MKTKWTFPILFCIILTFLGCAFGKKIPYEKMKVNLTYSGSKSISLSVLDQREMVIDHSRKPDFVGYTRSGAGIAFPMGTESGKSLAELLQEVISVSFTNKGYTVITVSASYNNSFDEIKNKLLATSSERHILFKLNKMHSDYYFATGFCYDVDLNIYDNKGNILISKNFKKDQTINGGTFMGTGNDKEYFPAYLENEIQSWLNDQQISEKLR